MYEPGTIVPSEWCMKIAHASISYANKQITPTISKIWFESAQTWLCLYLCKHGHLPHLASQAQGTEYIKLDEIKCQL
jgi:hypothetical protein